LRIGGDFNQGRLKLRVDLQGDASNIVDLTAKIYLQAEQVNLAAFAEPGSRLAEQFHSNLNLSLWGDFSAQQATRWVAQWQDSRLQWGEGFAQQLEIHSGLSQVIQQGELWRVDKLPWDMAINGAASDFSLQGLLSPTQQRWRLSGLNLAAWSATGALYQEALPTLDWPSLIQAGELVDGELSYQQQSSSLSYKAELKALATEGQGFIPKLTGLNVTLQGDLQQAHIQLQQQGEFHLLEQFKQGLNIEQLDASVNVDFGESGFSISSASTHLLTPELDFAGQWRLAWAKGQKWPFLSLMANAEIKDAAKAFWYYPEVMPDKVYGYLEKALLAGQAKHSQVLWYGTLNHYPYNNMDGIFQAYVPLENASFQFDPDWPALQELQLDLLFQNDGLFMESQQAKLGAVPAQRISASIPRFYRHSELYITGELAGEASDVQAYLQQSPVEALSSSLQQLPLSGGKVKGEVYLNIPLAGGKVDVNGHVDFLGNNLNVLPTGMNLQQVTGRLVFQNEKLRSSGLTAVWRDLPLSLKLATKTESRSYQLEMDLAGRWPVADMERAFAMPLAVYASGSLDWQGDLAIQLKPDGLFDYQGDFRSELLGLGLKMPAPMDKSAQQSWPSLLSINGNQLSSMINLESNKILSLTAQVDFSEGQKKLQYALLNLGENNGLRWQGQGLAMSFDFAELELMPWLNWAKQQTNNTAVVPESEYTNVSLVVPELLFVRGTVAKAKLLGQTIEQLDIAFLPRSKTPLQIESQQLVASLAVPKQPSLDLPVHLNIEKALLADVDFSLLEQSPQAEVAIGLNEQAEVSLITKLPPLIVDCQDCQLGPYRLGKFNLNLPIAQQNMQNGRLRVDWGHTQLSSDLFWTLQDGQESAGLKGGFTSNSLEKLIGDMGYDSPLKNTPARYNFDLNWQDSLLSPQKESLNGRLELKTDKGVVTEISDKGTRILSLASLDTIRRRLQLDFSDVFEKGLHFDSMSASVNFDHGVADNQDFYLDGVAGVMRGKGKLDLASGKIDYRVSYSPKVTSSLPVLAAFLVTPATGVAVLALSKLLEPVVEVVTQIDFALKGNIAEPELIELERVKKEITVPDEFRQ
uniref:YhdP family protein n=1 Tax=Agarivorans sp. TaxID=1872412 RepID=UPI003D075A01